MQDVFYIICISYFMRAVLDWIEGYRSVACSGRLAVYQGSAGDLFLCAGVGSLLYINSDSDRRKVFEAGSQTISSGRIIHNQKSFIHNISLNFPFLFPIIMVDRRRADPVEKKEAIRIGVCDDEKEIRDSIGRNIRLIYKDACIVQYGDGRALIGDADAPDILFLDIRMEGMDGMETARKIRKAGRDTTIIFVTAMEDYVFQAFDVGAFHYLLKPFDKAKFYEVLHRAVEERRRIKARDTAENAGILVKTGTVTQRVFFSEILYLEVFNRKVAIHRTGDDVEFYGRLSGLEKELSEDFVRCHRAYIVNLKYVQSYDTNSITLENGDLVPLAKQKYREFVRKYLKYMDRLRKTRRGEDADV